MRATMERDQTSRLRQERRREAIAQSEEAQACHIAYRNSSRRDRALGRPRDGNPIGGTSNRSGLPARRRSNNRSSTGFRLSRTLDSRTKGKNLMAAGRAPFDSDYVVDALVPTTAAPSGPVPPPCIHPTPKVDRAFPGGGH